MAVREDFELRGREFSTEAEARAFLEGIAYVNDGSVWVEDVVQDVRSGLWLARYRDADADAEDANALEDGEG